MLTLAIPNFRGERYIADTLKSLRDNQPDVRWWLQDAASDDRSVVIANEFASAQDHIISEPDAGQTDALNRAFARMGGELIGFINSDDLLAPGAAAAVCNYFETHPEVDLVYGEIEWIDTEGNVTGHHAGRIDSLEEVLNIYEVWWQKRQWVQPEVFFRRSLWEKVGPFDTRYQLAFDFDFWVRCFMAGAKVARLPKVLAQFRIHDAQKSKAARQAADEIRLIVERHLLNAPLLPRLKTRLEAALDYDRYQLAAGPYQTQRPSFIHYLAKHPGALRLPAVRKRLFDSTRSPVSLKS